MKTVLVIEDDQHIANALHARLSANELNVEHAYDATSALSIAKRTEPDLVVLDISMPGGDGFIVAERLRNWRGDDLPLIFITASKKPGLRERAIELNAAEYFEKPFDGNKLVESVVRAL